MRRVMGIGTILFFATATSAVTGRQTTTPAAITGMPSGARHCLSATGSNVHNLGWIDANTSYSVSFDPGVQLTSAVARFDLAENRATYGFGNPDFSSTATTAGTMALVVSGNGQPACYRYKTEIRSTSAIVTSAGPSAQKEIATVAHDAGQEAASARAISGTPSSGTYCVSENAASVQGLGRVEAGASIALTFSADFNAAAGLIVVNAASQQRSAWRSVSAGSTEPSITVSPTHAGELILYVGSVGNAAGCYRYKLESR